MLFYRFLLSWQQHQTDGIPTLNRGQIPLLFQERIFQHLVNHHHKDLLGHHGRQIPHRSQAWEDHQRMLAGLHHRIQEILIRTDLLVMYQEELVKEIFFKKYDTGLKRWYNQGNGGSQFFI